MRVSIIPALFCGLPSWNSSTGSAAWSSGGYARSQVPAGCVNLPARAHFPAVKSFDTFDFTAIASLNKPLVLELARCEYIVARDNIIA